MLEIPLLIDLSQGCIFQLLQDLWELDIMSKKGPMGISYNE
jgi:hypothetical protein